MGVVPSKTLDKQLRKSEHTIEVAGRLGVDVHNGGVPCGFDGLSMDAKGKRGLS